jgi:crotonobetainyl-CoA:carnitine CoA-transferase CaiB-like acyl-CoA transferase
VLLSPFGQDGPYRDRSSTDVCDQAVGGFLYLSGAPEREPLQGPRDQAAYAAGTFAAIGALAALRSRATTGRGQTVEVAHHEVLAALHQFTELKWTHGGEVLRRMGNRYAGPGSPIGMYRAGDGQLAMTVATAAHMEVLLAVTGLEQLLERPDVTSIYDIMVNAAILDPPLNEWLGERAVAEVVELFQSVRVAAAPVLTMHQLLADPHLEARGWWREVSDGPHAVRVPGAPFHLQGRPWRVSAETTDAAGSATVGGASSPAAAPLVHAAGPAPAPLVDAASPAAAPPQHAAGPNPPPLAGLRVLDLTRVWAGPLAARILADLGADVVMIEAPWARGPREVPPSYVEATRFFPDNEAGERPWNRNGFVNKFALGKRSVALDIGEPEGKAAFERLVAAADVVIENYSPRVMPNFGLGEDRLLELNAHLVYVTMPGYGRSGPAQDYSAYGPVLDSHAGLSSLMGYPELDAWKCGIAWPDPVAGIHTALATLAALWDRDADPQRRGRVIEVAQFETAVSMIGDRLVEAQLTGVDQPLPGNRDPDIAPQGVYPASGDDRWIALSVPTEASWAALCREAALPAEWAAWPLHARQSHHDEIDDAIAAWSAKLDATDATRRLQSAGVPAAPVVDGPALVGDPHLAARSFFVEVTQADSGTHPWPRLPILLGATPAKIQGPAPLLGEHNHEVLADWGGLSPGELAGLEAAGVLATEPPPE